MKLLFVCAGNTCRSPLALALCRLRRPEHEARSRGMAAAEGAPATAHAKSVAEEYGGSLAEHKAATLKPEDIAWADRVYVMTAGMGDCLRERCPESAEKVSLLPCGEVEDPYGRELADYRRTAEALERGILSI